ncbi:non-specific lipid-transfer protein 1-like [Andrographis paniculata]|uniref:non-specific lipid-transfer protein 1-like n=1 Tax=Andrographis paniculata TaxID=175694 RepID=UPI0021E7526A|nr:non-specific lipid-transfer protein 1-like [Andrographis paniculata]
MAKGASVMRVSLLVMIMIMLLLCSAAAAAAAKKGGGGGLSCKTVVDRLMPCKEHLTKGGSVPSKCCSSMKALQRQANTKSARQTACQCLKLSAKAYKVNEKYAAALPSACNINNIGYAISYSTDCNRVK